MIYLVIRGVSAFAFFLAEVAMGVYFVTIIGLTPLQLVLVGTALEATEFLFEVPTGVVADVYSRRLSIILGMFLMGAGFVVWGFFPIFAAALLGQALWGLGTTFTSGAEAAWISDEVGEAHVARLYVRGLQAEQVGGLVGIALGAVLGRLDVTRPRIVARALLVCNALLMAGMITFAVAPVFGLAVGAYWVANVARRVRRPLYDAWLNRGLDPAVRATVLSMGGQADAFGQIAGGPVLGLAANAWSIRAAIAIAGIILWPAFWLYNHALQRTSTGRSDSESQGS